MNPAVTIGMLIAGRISVIRSVLYIIFQCLGAIAGTAAVKVSAMSYRAEYIRCERKLCTLFKYLTFDFFLNLDTHP